jgi:TPR repeat protein
MLEENSVGARVVNELYRLLQVNEEWSLFDHRGFTWWGHHLAQRIWIDDPISSDGVELSTVYVATDVVRNVAPSEASFETVSELNRFALLYSLVVDPEQCKATYHAKVYVHEGTEEYLTKLLMHVTALQAADANVRADQIATLLGGEADRSAHPESGYRSEPDDMMSVIGGIYVPHGAEPSRYAEDFSMLSEMDPSPSLATNYDANGLTAEFPFTGASPASYSAISGEAPSTALLRANVDIKHPSLGTGCLVRLTLPTHIDDCAIANELNYAESRSWTKSHLLGSWCIDGDSLNHISFLPAACYVQGLLSAIFVNSAVRCRWALNYVEARDGFVEADSMGEENGHASTAESFTLFLGPHIPGHLEGLFGTPEWDEYERKIVDTMLTGPIQPEREGVLDKIKSSFLQKESTENVGLLETFLGQVFESTCEILDWHLAMVQLRGFRVARVRINRSDLLIDGQPIPWPPSEGQIGVAMTLLGAMLGREWIDWVATMPYHRMENIPAREPQEIACMDIDELTERAVGGDVLALNDLAEMYYKGNGVVQDLEQAEYWVRKSADLGDPSGLSNLGIMYRLGEAVAKDVVQAEKLFKKAAEHKLPEAFENLGDIYYHGEGVSQDFETAFGFYSQAAEVGSVGGQGKLATILRLGEGVDQDLEKACYWYRQAAEQGEEGAQCSLGLMYQRGEGLKRDLDQAEYWFLQAAEQGLDQAFVNLGFLYNGDEETKQDIQKAAYWFTQAAEQGNAMAQFNLAAIYLNHGESPEDFTEALKWFTASAENGNVRAQFHLGEIYEGGMGGSPNAEQALHWYQMAADHGSSDAQCNLGVVYINGRIVEQDFSEGLRWLQKAIDQNNLYAITTLGELFESGLGVPQDSSQALHWFQVAADQEFREAQHRLGSMYNNGIGVEQSFAQALVWLRKSADQGHPVAQYDVGVIHYNGRSVPQDYDEAVRWYRLSAEQGCADAQNNLGVMFQNGFGVAQDGAVALKMYLLAAEQGYALAQYNAGCTYLNGLGVDENPVEAEKWLRRAAEQGFEDAAILLDEQ